MNPSKIPINQHSLQSLELWLTDLGAVKDVNNPSKWYLLLSNWNATIIFEQEDLNVIYLLPPLCITDDQLEKSYWTIRQILDNL